MLGGKCTTKKNETLADHKWLLHHNNTPAHMSLKTTELVTNYNMVIVPHPTYSLDLAHVIFVSQIENKTGE
jgi:hypothetical protein